MRIAVYCSSREGLSEKFTLPATQLGEWMGRQGHTLVYGGVEAGLMHTVAQSVYDWGGQLIGIVPQPFLSRAEPLLDRVIECEDLGERKNLMMRIAEVFIALPGGIGTIDEWITTLSQIIVNGEDKRKILVLNTDGVFDAQFQQLKNTSESAFARGKDIDRSINCHTIEEIIAELKKIQKS